MSSAPESLDALSRAISELPPASCARELSILLVSHHDDGCEMFASALAELGCPGALTRCADSAKALEMSRAPSLSFDAAFVDLHAAPLDALTFLRGCTDIPYIVIVGAPTGRGIITECMRLGAASYQVPRATVGGYRDLIRMLSAQLAAAEAVH